MSSQINELASTESQKDIPMLKKVEKTAQVPMHPRRSFNKYPRVDNVYKTKSSYNFDMMRTKVFFRRRGSKEEVWLWFAHFVTGVAVGTVAFFMSFCEDHLTRLKADTVQSLIDSNNNDLGWAFLFYMGFAVCCVVPACLLTIYVGPGANGSGVAEIMGLLNGINYPDVIGLRTLLVKIVGTTLAVSGGLCIGKEGPLLHVGAIIGAMTCFLPIEGIRCLQNDVSKR
jgi:hypothetical protein